MLNKSTPCLSRIRTRNYRSVDRIHLVLSIKESDIDVVSNTLIKTIRFFILMKSHI